MWNTLTLTTSLLLYIIETEANTCYYSASNGEVLNFRCYNFGEYCCGRHCCASVAAFYRLWYFWLCVLLMVLLCSGGGYWYKRRYYQSNFMMPAGQTRMAGGRNNTVHTQNNFAFDSGIDRYPPCE
ncbi:vesicular, overexpressed in cancer, prosurvival protein 1-like [Lingula anatina]|uniref:WW domain binding protein VOPP1 n=1 Tax=Lingula anatina TaxID=7574 RepID=A0A1S3JLE2_LINAN|nr:vesicular, overexpressed in cancer, prosurvival protein 1-like [Lingula anatina]|eukprot:XP_013410729.1 vesicular, overexpressed in cancer, prosurvival protein 1-like [Lingula anatina]